MKRVCVVGAGGWGRNHIRALAELSHLGGVVETDAASLAEVSRAYPAAVCLPDLEAALSHSFDDARGFDGFVVATPADTHYAIALRILESRKPVLVEKPLALNTRDAAELIRVAARENVNLMAGHLMLFHPAIRKIKEMLDAGKIGDLQYLYSNRLNLGTVRTEENILWSFAPHDISIFQYWIGRAPHRVFSRGAAFLQPGLHDTTMTCLEYPGGLAGHIFVSWLHPFKEHRLVLIGSKGMISFEDSSENKELFFYAKGIEWVEGRPLARQGPTEIVPYEPKKPLTEELRYFVERLSGGRIEIATGESALEALAILERASASLMSDASNP